VPGWLFPGCSVCHGIKIQERDEQNSRERKGGRWNWSIAYVYSDLVLDVKALQREWESVRSENERDLDCSINPDKQDDSGACCFTCLAHLHLDVWALYLLSPLINNSNSLALRSRSCTPPTIPFPEKVSLGQRRICFDKCVSVPLLIANELSFVPLSPQDINEFNKQSSAYGWMLRSNRPAGPSN